MGFFWPQQSDIPGPVKTVAAVRMTTEAQRHSAASSRNHPRAGSHDFGERLRSLSASRTERVFEPRSREEREEVEDEGSLLTPEGNAVFLRDPLPANLSGKNAYRGRSMKLLPKQEGF